MNPTLLVYFAAFYMGMMPITSDFYLPALPTLTQDLQASMAQAQLTLSSTLLAFGLSQMVWGPLSDRVGRRPLLLFGFALYTIAAWACYAVSNVEMLIVCRAFQGMALGAVSMSARAMTRDVYEPQEAARLMSKGLSGAGVFALLSVPLGALTLQTLGWRATVALPGVYSAAMLMWTYWKFQETNGRKNPLATEPAQLVRTWQGIVSHPTFWAYSLLALCSYASLFVFLATSSFVFMQVLGESKLVYSLVVSTVSAIYIASTFMARRLMARYGLVRVVQMAAAVTLLSALLFIGLYALGLRSTWALALPLFVYMLSHGCHQPAGQAGCTAPFPQAAGAASAMAGFLMMTIAFGVGLLIGKVMNGTVMPLVFGVAFWNLMVVLVAWLLVPRFGQLDK